MRKEGGREDDKCSRSMFFCLCCRSLFPFLPSKAKLIGDVPMNRQNAANCSLRYGMELDRDCQEDGDEIGEDGDS